MHELFRCRTESEKSPTYFNFSTCTQAHKKQQQITYKSQRPREIDLNCHLYDLIDTKSSPVFCLSVFFLYFCLWFVYNKSLIKVEIVISFISVLSCEQSKLCRVGVANTIFVHLIKKKQWQLSTNCSIYELKHACISTNSTKSPQDLHPLFRQGYSRELRNLHSNVIS